LGIELLLVGAAAPFDAKTHHEEATTAPQACGTRLLYCGRADLLPLAGALTNAAKDEALVTRPRV
jgi:hypothetical protein